MTDRIGTEETTGQTRRRTSSDLDIATEVDLEIIENVESKYRVPKMK